MDRVFICDTFLTGEKNVYESVENPGSGVLRTVKGPVAEWSKLNRNKRMYSEKLWDNVLESSYVKEQTSYKTLFGEAGHPADRFEVDFGRVSHRISEMWKVPATNQIYATIDILDTPMGRILNTLYEAGGIIGYSSRAGGTLTPKKGYTEVDEKSYNFVTFDAVPFPSVESARPGVSEGVEVEVPKTELPEEVHEKLCKIISESAMSCKDAVRDLIYSINGYDLAREIALLEGNSGSSGSNAEPVAEEPDEDSDKAFLAEATTLLLLKENTLQIDRLKSVNQTLMTAKATLEEENRTLRESLDSTVSDVQRLVAESEKVDARIEEAAHMSDDTIKGLRETIRDLRGDLDDKNYELSCLKGVHEAATALRIENDGLRSKLDSASSSAEESAKAELDEVYREVALLISEAKQKDSEIQQMNEAAEKSTETIQALQEDADNLRKELTSLRADSSRLNEGVERAKILESENEALRRQIDEITESLDMAAEKSDRYRDELISVIASRYNLTLESVKSKLPVGFNPSDIYSVCESMSNSVGRISFPSIVSESGIKEKSSSAVSTSIGAIPFTDRRGRVSKK